MSRKTRRKSKNGDEPPDPRFRSHPSIRVPGEQSGLELTYPISSSQRKYTAKLTDRDKKPVVGVSIEYGHKVSLAYLAIGDPTPENLSQLLGALSQVRNQSTLPQIPRLAYLRMEEELGRNLNGSRRLSS